MRGCVGTRPGAGQPSQRDGPTLAAQGRQSRCARARRVRLPVQCRVRAQLSPERIRPAIVGKEWSFHDGAITPDPPVRVDCPMVSTDTLDAGDANINASR